MHKENNQEQEQKISSLQTQGIFERLQNTENRLQNTENKLTGLISLMNSL